MNKQLKRRHDHSKMMEKIIKHIENQRKKTIKYIKVLFLSFSFPNPNNNNNNNDKKKYILMLKKNIRKAAKKIKTIRRRGHQSGSLAISQPPQPNLLIRLQSLCFICGVRTFKLLYSILFDIIAYICDKFIIFSVLRQSLVCYLKSFYGFKCE